MGENSNKKFASQVHILKKDDGESSTGRKLERSTVCWRCGNEGHKAAD